MSPARRAVVESVVDQKEYEVGNLIWWCPLGISDARPALVLELPTCSGLEKNFIRVLIDGRVDLVSPALVGHDKNCTEQSSLRILNMIHTQYP